MQKKYLYFMVFFASLVTASCTQFDTPGIVKDRRILAIQASPPELTKATIPVSGMVTMTALVVEPGMQFTTLNYAWGYCQIAPAAGPNPAGGGGGGPAGGGSTTTSRCDATQYRLVASGASTAVQLPLSQAIALNDPEPAKLVELLNNGSTAPAPEIRVQLKVGDGVNELFAVKKIAVSTTNLTPNHNPSLSEIDIDGAVSLPAMTWTYGSCNVDKRVTATDGNGNTVSVCTHYIAPVVLAADMEDYTEFNRITGTLDPRKERYEFSWYADAGTLKAETTTQPDPRLSRPYTEGVATEWREPTTLPAAAVNIWLVVRDGRGGVVWAQRQITLQ
ncbi:MAG: hypothetical protein AABY83_01800 [Pseudomonadota bacterium]